MLQRLVPGVVTSFFSAALPIRRVELSAGVSPASGARYEKGAIVPLAPWRPLEQDEWLQLTVPAVTANTPVVHVVKLPAQLAEQARSLALSFGEEASTDSLRALAGSAGGRILANDLREYAVARYGLPGAAQEISGGICLRDRDLATITLNAQTGELVGLHVDDWYGLPLDERHTAPNRICANIGLRDRFFLFINIPIPIMRDFVLTAPLEELAKIDNGLETRASIRGNLPGRVGGTAVARAFMSLFPRYPVLRVRICPGEAYLAPTECIVHDGSSVGTNYPDLTCSLRGYFNPRLAHPSERRTD